MPSMSIKRGALVSVASATMTIVAVASVAAVLPAAAPGPASSPASSQPGTSAPASIKDYVDLELVLAVDVSLSMDIDEQRLQRDGYVAALRDPAILKAIQSGPNRRIALTYLEWAGTGIQTVVIPWRVIDSPASAAGFADDLAAKPIQRAILTSISAALEVAGDLFQSSPVRGLRRVVDVSGDGPNNSGSTVEAARDTALASGIIINGLAIRLKRGGPYSYFDLDDLDRYYKDCVIGGPGAFVLSVRDRSEFAAAIRQKLLLEIAGMAPAGTTLHRVQLAPTAPKYDCLVGEKAWRRYQRGMGDPY